MALLWLGAALRRKLAIWNTAEISAIQLLCKIESQRSSTNCLECLPTLCRFCCKKQQTVWFERSPHIPCFFTGIESRSVWMTACGVDHWHTKRNETYAVSQDPKQAFLRVSPLCAGLLVLLSVYSKHNWIWHPFKCCLSAVWYGPASKRRHTQCNWRSVH